MEIYEKDVHNVTAWGNGFVEYLRLSEQDLLAEITEKKKLDEALKAKIVDAINKYKATIG